MRIIFTSDLHENINLYEEIIQLVKDTAANYLIIGGDFFNPTRDIFSQHKFIDQYLMKFLNRISIPVYAISGNTDFPSAIDYLKKVARIQFLDVMPLEIRSGINLIGYSMINPSPFTIKDMERRDLKQDFYKHWKPILISNPEHQLIEMKVDYLNDLLSIEEELDLVEKSEDFTLWVMHAPPYGGKLDVTRQNEHVGSKAIQRKIEVCQPNLTLHGHIHESPYVTGSWFQKTGKTISINPGSGNRLHAVIIDVGENKLHIRHSIFQDICTNT